jgi:di/tricarboxylate transporter
MNNLSQNQKVNMMDFWMQMTSKIFKKFQHVQFSKKKCFCLSFIWIWYKERVDFLDVTTELEQKFCIYPHYSSFLTKKMFAAIFNSFFIVLLSMVFVQRNLVEINIYKKIWNVDKRPYKFISMFKKQQRNTYI